MNTPTGGRHECSIDCDDGSGCGFGPGSADARSRASRQRDAERRIRSELVRRVASRGTAVVRAAGIGSRPRDEQIASERCEQLRSIGRRLYQSDPTTLGGRGRKEVRRDFAQRHHLSELGEPVLARTGAVHLQAHGNGGSAAAAPDHVPSMRLIPPRRSRHGTAIPSAIGMATRW